MVLADLQLATIVTKILAVTEEAAVGLKKDEDWKAYATVHFDLAKCLHSLGVFGAQEKPIDPSVQRDQLQVEIAALVELELKKQRRAAETLQMHREGG
jgi:hypothetical protein